MALTLRGEVMAVAMQSGDPDWQAAAEADPVVYAPHTPYYSALDPDPTPGVPRCCRFDASAPIHRANVVARFMAVLPHLIGSST